MFEILRKNLITACAETHRYNAPDNVKAPYVVWSDGGDIDMVADNKHAESAREGTVDLFLAEENDVLVQAVCDALDVSVAVWALNSVQYEEDTGLIHYEWTFGVM